MLYGTDVRVSLIHFKKILLIGFLLSYKMSNINIERNPFDEIFRNKTPAKAFTPPAGIENGHKARQGCN